MFLPILTLNICSLRRGDIYTLQPHPGWGVGSILTACHACLPVRLHTMYACTCSAPAAVRMCIMCCCMLRINAALLARVVACLAHAAERGWISDTAPQPIGYWPTGHFLIGGSVVGGLEIVHCGAFGAFHCSGKILWILSTKWGQIPIMVLRPTNKLL